MKKIPFSGNIDFSEGGLTKEDLTEFVELLRTGDPNEYANEGKDGFEDLYNYWVGLGSGRFLRKLVTNREKYGK